MLVQAQGTANQQRLDHIIPFAIESRPVGHGQKGSRQKRDTGYLTVLVIHVLVVLTRNYFNMKTLI